MAFQYSIRQLREVRDFFKEHPEGLVKLGRVWPSDTLTSGEWHCWFMRCLHKRINRHQGSRGRKDTREWFIEMRRVQHQLNTPRLIIHWLPVDLRDRFSHRLWCQEDQGTQTQKAWRYRDGD